MVSFRIGASQGGSLSNVGNVGGTLRVQEAQSTQSALQSDDAARVSLSQTPKVSSETPGVSTYLARREQATSAIGDIREEQLALAEQAESIAYGQEFEDIQTRINELQEEVERIDASATFRGQDLLSGGVFGAGTSDENEDGYIVSVSDASSLSTSITSLEAPEDATALIDQLTSLATDASQISSDTAQAQGVAQSAGTDSSESVTQPRDRLSVNEAEDLARSISAELTSTLTSQFGGSTSPTLSLIESLNGGLSADRVRSLTED